MQDFSEEIIHIFWQSMGVSVKSAFLHFPCWLLDRRLNCDLSIFLLIRLPLPFNFSSYFTLFSSKSSPKSFINHPLFFEASTDQALQLFIKSHPSNQQTIIIMTGRKYKLSIYTSYIIVVVIRPFRRWKGASKRDRDFQPCDGVGYLNFTYVTALWVCIAFAQSCIIIAYHGPPFQSCRWWWMNEWITKN